MESMFNEFAIFIQFSFAYIIGVGTLPAIKAVHRVVTAVGALVIIYTFLRDNKWSRQVFFAIIVVVSIFIITGCSNHHVSDTGRVIPKSDLLGKELCWNSREEYRGELSNFLSCSNPSMIEWFTFNVKDVVSCQDQKHILVEKKTIYDRCMSVEKEDNLVINPFNLLTPIKE